MYSTSGLTLSKQHLDERSKLSSRDDRVRSETLYIRSYLPTIFSIPPSRGGGSGQIHITQYEDSTPSTITIALLKRYLNCVYKSYSLKIRHLTSPQIYCKIKSFSMYVVVVWVCSKSPFINWKRNDTLISQRHFQEDSKKKLVLLLFKGLQRLVHFQASN